MDLNQSEFPKNSSLMFCIYRQRSCIPFRARAIHYDPSGGGDSVKWFAVRSVFAIFPRVRAG